MKKKSLFIILGVVLILIICIGVLLVLKKEDSDEVSKTLKEDTYTMYVSINPLVKFEFVETYYECKDLTTKEVSVCSEYGSKVVSFQLINDDAKEYFEGTDFTDMNLIEVLSTMRDVLIEQGVDVELFSITTDWNLRYTKEELIEEILKNSTYDNEFSIEINIEDTISEDEIIDNYTEEEQVQEQTTSSSSSSTTSSSSSSSSSNSSTSSSSDTSISCTPKKFSNTYTYVYETEDACKSIANSIFYDIYDNVDSRVEIWSCDKIVDDCGTTWYGISFQIYDNGYQTVYY